MFNLQERFTKWFGNVQVFKYPPFFLLGHSAYRINGVYQREILNVLKPGDVLLRRYDHYLSGLMIPGYFTHVAMYVGDNQIVHMLGEGIVKEDILTFLRCDAIAVLRIASNGLTFDASGDQSMSDIDYALNFAEKCYKDKIPYDFDFDFKDNRRFSCTEFIHVAYKNFLIVNRRMKNVVVPDDFLNSTFFTNILTRGY